MVGQCQTCKWWKREGDRAGRCHLLLVKDGAVFAHPHYAQDLGIAPTFGCSYHEDRRLVLLRGVLGVYVGAFVRRLTRAR